MIYAFGLDKHLPTWPERDDYVSILAKEKTITILKIDEFLKRKRKI
jgi:hypothetical protein